MTGGVSTAPEHLLADLVRLQRDEDVAARAVGVALAAAVLDAMTHEEDAWVGQIEALRERLEASYELIDVALANTRSVVKPAEVGDTCRRRSKRQPWGMFLMALARALAPERCLELGTCLGISSAYLAAGLHVAGKGRLVTLEGAPALADHSRSSLASLGLTNVDVEAGLFAVTLAPALERAGPVGLAFVDGHHQEGATLAYFEQIAQRLTEPAVVVFDDIRWSDGMERAWAAILTHPRVQVAVDLTSVGVCVVGPATGAAPRLYRFPTISVMQPRFEPVADPPSRVQPDQAGITRLNWTLGPKGEPNWLNVAPHRGPGIEIPTDVRHGLPVDDDSVDCIVSMNVLPSIPLMDAVEVLSELRRVLKPGGTLRLGLPDLEHSMDALRLGDRNAFVVSDRDSETLSGKFITQVLWYGLFPTLFTAEFIEELLQKAGFSHVHRCAFGETAGDDDGIVALDDQSPWTLLVEAVK